MVYWHQNDLHLKRTFARTLRKVEATRCKVLGVQVSTSAAVTAAQAGKACLRSRSHCQKEEEQRDGFLI